MTSPTSTKVDRSLTALELRRLLPATFRNGPAWIGSPHNRVQHFLKSDLSIEQLNQVLPYASILGKAKPPSPLHHQQALGLEIVVTEKMDTHLLWAKGKIFIKPLPRYLLEEQFCKDFLECPSDCSYASEFKFYQKAGLMRSRKRLSNRTPCDHRKFWKCAMGFVFSYIALIAHESDFEIAKSSGLLPGEMDFDDWKAFVDRILSTPRIYGQLDERFTYGELDMARVNTLLMFQQPARYLLRRDETYGICRAHTSPVLSVTLYLGAVLAWRKARPLVPGRKASRVLALVILLACLCLWATYALSFTTGNTLPTFELESKQ